MVTINEVHLLGVLVSIVFNNFFSVGLGDQIVSHGMHKEHGDLALFGTLLWNYFINVHPSCLLRYLLLQRHDEHLQKFRWQLDHLGAEVQEQIVEVGEGAVES